MSSDGFFSNTVQVILTILATVLSAGLIAAVGYIFRLNNRVCNIEYNVNRCLTWLGEIQKDFNYRNPVIEKLITKTELIRQELRQIKFARGYPGGERENDN